MPREEFIGEPIEVDVSSMSPEALATGAPSCPKRFTWRQQVYTVIELLDQGKQLRAHDSKETYVKSHSFRVRTAEGYEMVLRCDRQVRGNPWRLFSLKRPT